MKGTMKRVALAVGVAVGGLSLAPTAGAVSVAANNLGQALIFPYYTVRGGWTTLFGVTNTSNQVVAVKVRFREAYNSRDVFDFNLILSPYDLWTAWVTDSPNGPVIRTEDSSCTVGNIVGTGATGVTFPAPVSYVGAFADGGPTTVDRMREGYVEMIMMGASPGTPSAVFPLAAGAIHGSTTGTPPGCAALVSAFQNPALLGSYGACPTGTSAVSGVSGTLRGEFCNYPSYLTTPPGATAPVAVPLNPLKGTYALVNGAKGFNAVGLPVALQNFRNTGAMTLQLDSVGAVAFNDSWHEPSLYSATSTGFQFLPTLAATDPGGLLGNTVAGDRVSVAFLHTNVINEWSRRSNPAAGWVTATDWVLTFPTKNLFVDNDPGNRYAGRNTGRGNASAATSGNAAAPFAQMFVDTALTTPVRRGSSCDSISLSLYDREERQSSGLGFSPGASPQLCYEANVLTFNQGLILNSPIAGSVNYTDPFLFGWMNIGLTTMNGGSPNSINFGLPVVGFAITSRDDSVTALLSEAALYDHSYIGVGTSP
ncbi:MAG: hypothetical protein P9G45_10825 [Candidatus Contendobacter sp.]|nr:hypothetical protein [Candidatus Contendobacter sp.]